MVEKMNRVRHVMKHKIKRVDAFMELIRTVSSITVVILQLIIFSKLYG